MFGKDDMFFTEMGYNNRYVFSKIRGAQTSYLEVSKECLTTHGFTNDLEQKPASAHLHTWIP